MANLGIGAMALMVKGESESDFMRDSVLLAAPLMALGGGSMIFSDFFKPKEFELDHILADTKDVFNKSVNEGERAHISSQKKYLKKFTKEINKNLNTKLTPLQVAEEIYNNPNIICGDLPSFTDSKKGHFKKKGYYNHLVKIFSDRELAREELHNNDESVSWDYRAPLADRVTSLSEERSSQEQSSSHQ